MKKALSLLIVSILMGFSLKALAQNDSSRSSPKVKELSDSIQIESDTITIGNMIIVKKKGEQNYNSNKSRRTIKKETKSFFKRISKEIKAIKASVVTKESTEGTDSLVAPSTSASNSTVKPKKIPAKVEPSTVQAKTKASKAKEVKK